MNDSSVLHTNESAFQQDVLQADRPVLVDFWAEWCGPCRAIAPLLEEVAAERQNSLRVVKVNVDESRSWRAASGSAAFPP